METVNWGIIGCGDVAEVKSGPAFKKVENSRLIAVMRRNGDKAKDFAERHGVPHWYSNAQQLLNHPDINAVYIATPPSSHLPYALQALEAGKAVYLEKPMALSKEEALQLGKAVKESGGKLTVAHYRRKLPAFLKVKEQLDAGAIGKVRFADIHILQPQKSGIIAQTEENWRVDPAISGGGYFHDLAPHQLDLMYHYFGAFDGAAGFAHRQEKNYAADDIVNGIISFRNGIQFRGIWSFNVAAEDKKDQCRIYGSEGSILFSFFGEEVHLKRADSTETFRFHNPANLQLPMIQATVDYFLGNGPNPCSAEEGLVVMELMDRLTGK